MVQLNSAIQSALLFAFNQSIEQTKKLTMQTALTAQSLALNATLLMTQASSLAQNASLLAASQVSLQLSLFNDMVSAVSNNSQPVSRFLLAKGMNNRTKQAISFSQTIISTESASLSASNNSLLLLTKTEAQIQILQLIISQTIAYSQLAASNVAQLIQLVANMESTAANLSDALNLTILSANVAYQAALQANAAQAVALQASIKAARLALCYPNPCMHGGLCTANSDNSTFTCFCSSYFKGTTCKSLKGESVFNAGKGSKNFEKMVRVDENDEMNKKT